MRRSRHEAPILLAAFAASCGSGTPGGPSTPTPPPPGHPVSGFVYYDENANGALDPDEVVRLPGVTIAVGSRTAQSSGGGRFTASDVPSGMQTASARQDTLPTYFRPGAPLSVSVPPAGDVAVPAVLALGEGMRANVYMAFGDSITSGDGSSGGGYRDWLEADLRAHLGKATLRDEGQSGTKSEVGAGRIGASLSRQRPAYALILYGTNDYNEPGCRDDRFPCYTIDSLRSMVQETRGWGAHPILGTIPPVNPAWLDRNPEERNDWVRRMNDLVRAMARQEQVAIAEVHGAFLAQSSLPALFADEKHPNDAGYRLISQAFFGAITRPYTTAASSRRQGLFRQPF